MKNNLSAIITIGILLIAAAACSDGFTTANISTLEFGKSETAQPAATTFDAGEKIYAVATVSNTSSKHNLNFKVTCENVAGKTKGEEIANESIPFEGARPIWLSFGVASAGEYYIEATLLDESGKKIDSKSGKITVKGEGAAVTTGEKKDDGR